MLSASVKKTVVILKVETGGERWKNDILSVYLASNKGVFLFSITLSLSVCRCTYAIPVDEKKKGKHAKKREKPTRKLKFNNNSDDNEC